VIPPCHQRVCVNGVLYGLILTLVFKANHSYSQNCRPRIQPLARSLLNGEPPYVAILAPFNCETDLATVRVPNVRWSWVFWSSWDHHLIVSVDLSIYSPELT
jgi:hypothetical protein